MSDTIGRCVSQVHVHVFIIIIKLPVITSLREMYLAQKRKTRESVHNKSLTK